MAAGMVSASSWWRPAPWPAGVGAAWGRHWRGVAAAFMGILGEGTRIARAGRRPSAPRGGGESPGHGRDVASENSMLHNHDLEGSSGGDGAGRRGSVRARPIVARRGGRAGRGDDENRWCRNSGPHNHDNRGNGFRRAHGASAVCRRWPGRRGMVVKKTMRIKTSGYTTKIFDHRLTAIEGRAPVPSPTSTIRKSCRPTQQRRRASRAASALPCSGIVVPRAVEVDTTGNARNSLPVVSTSGATRAFPRIRSPARPRLPKRRIVEVTAAQDNTIAPLPRLRRRGEGRERRRGAWGGVWCGGESPTRSGCTIPSPARSSRHGTRDLRKHSRLDHDLRL